MSMLTELPEMVSVFECCAIAVYAMCYSVINLCGYWTSGTLSAIASNGNTLYNVMGVKRHIYAS